MFFPFVFSFIFSVVPAVFGAPVPIASDARIVAVGLQTNTPSVVYYDGSDWFTSVVRSAMSTSYSLVRSISLSSVTYKWAVCTSDGSVYISSSGLTFTPHFNAPATGPTSCVDMDAGMVQSVTTTTLVPSVVALMKDSNNAPYLAWTSDPDAGVTPTAIWTPLNVTNLNYQSITPIGIAYMPISKRWYAAVNIDNSFDYLVTWDSKMWGAATMITKFPSGPLTTMTKLKNGVDSVFVGGTSIQSLFNIDALSSSQSAVLPQSTFSISSCGMSFYERPKDLCAGGLTGAGSHQMVCSDGNIRPMQGLAYDCNVLYTDSMYVYRSNAVPNNVISYFRYSSNGQFNGPFLFSSTLISNLNIVSLDVASTTVTPASVSSPIVWTSTTVSPQGSSVTVSNSISCLADWIVLGNVVISQNASSIVSVNQTLGIGGTWTQYASSPAWFARSLLINTGGTFTINVDSIGGGNLPSPNTNATFQVTIVLGTFVAQNTTLLTSIGVVVSIPSYRATTTTSCTLSAVGSSAQPIVTQSTLSALITLQQTCVDTTTTTTSTSTSPSSSSSSLSTGALIGIIVGSVVGGLTIVAIVVGVILHKRKKDQSMRAAMSKLSGIN